MRMPEHIINNYIFNISNERLDMLGRLFIYYNLAEEYGWHFCEFVYKYEKGIYENQFPYPAKRKIA